MARRTCEVTAPFFWLMPVMSSTLAPLRSRWAAMPISAPMVITPVPPMPVMRMLKGCASEGALGSGKRGKIGQLARGGFCPARCGTAAR